MLGARYFWESAIGPALLVPQARQAPDVAPPPAQPSEVRRKAKDGAHYSWEQFVQYYGQWRAPTEWSHAPVVHPEPSAAQPAPSSPPEPSPGPPSTGGPAVAPQPSAGTLQDDVCSLVRLLEARCEELGEGDPQLHWLAADE
eukprot:6104465-Alexandrium_andersonii.AAC.1